MAGMATLLSRLPTGLVQGYVKNSSRQEVLCSVVQAVKPQLAAAYFTPHLPCVSSL